MLFFFIIILKFIIKIKLDIKPCPPNFIFSEINYDIKIFPHDENFPQKFK